MKAAPYSLAALREYRQRKQQGGVTSPPTLADIPPDAPMEEGIVIGCWSGRAFVSWEKWLAAQPLQAFIAKSEDERG